MVTSELSAGGSSLPLTSSIAQRLPSYIIYEILRHLSAPLLTNCIKMYPWYLAHICSSWRIEFLRMRRNFWNEIDISLWQSYTGMKRTLDVLTMFLERNRGCPFSFALEAGPQRRRKLFSMIFNLFISESPRWRRVTLTIEMVDIPKLYRVKGQLKHLESLDLRCGIDYDIVPETFTNLFMTAPCLTRLSIRDISTWNFNWSIMTFMDLGWLIQEEVARLPSILSEAVRLETLILKLDDATLASNTSIVLPSLLSLVVNSFCLIQAITTPSLKTLYVDSDEDEDEPYHEPVGTMKSFLGRSRCHLQALKLGKINAASAIEILSHTPDIRTLYLYAICDSVVDVFGWLNGMHQVETPKLTCLQSLAVYHCLPPEKNEMYKILDFVAQRKTRVKDVGFVVEKLEKLDIERNWQEDQEACEALAEQLRKTCKLHDIQYSNERNEAVLREDVHARSQDPYVYPSSDRNDADAEWYSCIY